MKDIKVASVQFEHAPGDKQANLDKVRRFTAEAAEQGVELVVFPEMCVTGYWFLRDLSRDELLGTVRAGAKRSDDPGITALGQTAQPELGRRSARDQ